VLTPKIGRVTYCNNASFLRPLLKSGVRAETAPPSGGKGAGSARAARKSAARAREGDVPWNRLPKQRCQLPILSTMGRCYSRETIGGATAMQNTSHAVMSQRVEALDSPDDWQLSR
jgi:hypothetical protein